MGTPVNDSTSDILDFCRVSVSALKKVTSKDRRPVIVNGKLLFADKNPVVLFTSNFTVHSAIGLKDLKSPECSQDKTGEFLTMIERQLSEFERKYSVLNPRFTTQSGASTVYYDTDHFTNAIIIQSQTFTALTEHCLQADNTQYVSTAERLIQEFLTDYIVDYYSLYSILFTRRILSRHMSSETKGHLVAGLFEPLVVGTKLIPSPMLFTRNSWFMSMFNSDSTSVKQLASRTDSTASRLDLNCVAMCDISKVFSTPIVIDLHNRDWMFMALCGLMEALGQGTPSQRITQMMEAYPAVYARVLGDDDKRRRALFANILQVCYNKNTAVAVR